MTDDPRDLRFPEQISEDRPDLAPYLAQLRGAAADVLPSETRARQVLGVPAADLDALAREWRKALAIGERLGLADALWRTDIHEARIAAAKLLTQARLRPSDAAAWALLRSWLADLDGAAIADAVGIAAQRRIAAEPSRLDEVEGWTRGPQVWTRRAALTATLHLARLPHPKPAESAARDRILGWIEAALADRDGAMQTAVGGWLRDLSKHDPDRTRAFLDAHGDRMTPLAMREATRHLG